MLTKTQKQVTRDFIRRYCERAEANKAQIHYSQARPMTHLGYSPSREMTCDCSGFATGAFAWADRFTKYLVQDPNGLNYSGAGYTGTLLANNRSRRISLDRDFRVGDMGLYGSSLSRTTHVVICRRAGRVGTAVWTSHGSEAGPYAVYLRYRSDLLCVVRAEDLA